MKEGGLNLADRGNAFEEHVRKQVRKRLLSNKLLSKTFVNDKALTLHAGQTKEEIDLVWIVGAYILIGEVKCQLFPSTPIETYNYYEVLKSAVDQIKRKQIFIQNNLLGLFGKAKLKIPSDLGRYQVIASVITNLPFGAGYPIDSVPITDLKMLLSYIEGEQKFLVKAQGAEIKDSTNVNYFSSESEAGDRLLNYLLRPPVIKINEKYFKAEISPLLTQKEQKKVGYLRHFVELP